MLFNRLLFFAVFATGLGMTGYSFAETEKQSLTEEYFIQQAKGEALLIRINAFEAEFESVVSSSDGQALLRSAIPGSRIVPVFQYIDAAAKARQLNIQVSSQQHTARTEFGLELSRQVVWDARSNSLSRAYQLLSFGLQSGGIDNRANQTVKIDSLASASRLFERFGMREMRLWSDYFVAHMIMFHLHDYSMVYTMTRDILGELEDLKLQKIKLATLQLRAAAMIGLKHAGSLQSSVTDPIQSILSQTATLANSMGFHFEQAYALTLSAAEYAADTSYEKALEQYRRALAIADSIGDGDLATGIRESIVQIHALQGNAPASRQVLKEIETQLLEDGDGDELALNLLAQARLHIRGYRFRLALESLSQALMHQNDSAIRKQANFELAKVFYETGRTDDALKSLTLAGISTRPEQARRANSMIDMAEGLQILANIHRTRGEYEQMYRARSAEGLHKPHRAQYLYDQGLDLLAEDVNNRSKAQSLFSQSHKAAAATGNTDLLHLSRLQFCAQQRGTQGLCSPAKVRAAYDALLAGGVPRFAMEAMFLWARTQALSGRISGAIATLDRMVDEVHLYRHSLPGVLGAWYGERHEQFFDYYIDLLVGGSGGRNRVDDLSSLLAISKIRYIGKYSDFELMTTGKLEKTELLRVQLAQRAQAGNDDTVAALNKSINQKLSQIRQNFKKKFAFLSIAGIQAYLRSLEHDEMVLTYHLNPTLAQVWVARKGRVQRRSIANPAHIHAALQEPVQDLATIGISAFNGRMDDLGRRLITPVADLLTDKVYWIPGGHLLGFPFDALRFKNHYLAERHTFANLLSFPARPNPGSRLQSAARQNVFLAGHPVKFSGDYLTRLDTSSEIASIAELFVGPGLRIVQAAALLPDEFQDERFSAADLIHLSMPGNIDMHYPEQSSLALSGSETSVEQTLFTSEDIRSQPLGASLVFLSAVRMNKQPASDFASQLGLVSDFTEAGAAAVIAGLWGSEGFATEKLITDFYREFKASGRAAQALQDARRSYLENNRDNGLYDWAAYQLFVD